MQKSEFDHNYLVIISQVVPYICNKTGNGEGTRRMRVCLLGGAVEKGKRTKKYKEERRKKGTEEIEIVKVRRGQLLQYPQKEKWNTCLNKKCESNHSESGNNDVSDCDFVLLLQVE